jgi:cytoskeleton protein RodZ
VIQQATLGEILASADGLRALRIAHGVDAHDMAAHLGVPLRQLDAIEEGRWEELPGAAFVRPLLFAYGRRIGVEDRRLLVRLLPRELQDIDSTLQSDSQQSRLLPRGLLGFAHGGAGGGLVWLSLALLASMVVIHFYARPF